jgi:hypothetical protein
MRGIIYMEAVVEQVIAELAALNKKADTIIGIMKKPENKFIKVLEIAGAVITVMSFLSVIDIIRHWLGF